MDRPGAGRAGSRGETAPPRDAPWRPPRGSSPSCLPQRPEPVDFSFNPLADKKFLFWDPTLLEAVKMGDPHTHEFFRLLSLCHTVMSEEKNEGEHAAGLALPRPAGPERGRLRPACPPHPGELYYKAQSPDEGALVTAARNFGFVFRSRTPKTITVCEMGTAVTYQLLAILDFNNTRKRMSVIGEAGASAGGVGQPASLEPGGARGVTLPKG